MTEPPPRRALAVVAGLALAACGSPPTPVAAPRPTTTTTSTTTTTAPTTTAPPLERPQPAPRAQRARPAGTVAATLACIRRIESGGDYHAISPSGRFRGAYQMNAETWASVGGTGDPAHAAPHVQDELAARLLARRGLAPWPVPERQCQ